MIAIVGSGPAGVSAALYLARANKDVIIFTNHKSSLLKTDKIENYYGTGFISGKDLYQKGLDDLKSFNIKIIEEEIFNISLDQNFILETKNKSYQADKIILATGSMKQSHIKNINKFEGRGVSYCATCDGFFYKGKTLAVIGNNDFALHELDYLSNITNSLFLLTNGLEAPQTKFPIYKQKIKEVAGNESVSKIIFDDNTTLNIDGLFVAEQFADTNILAKKIGILTDKQGIIVNEHFETNIPGIYACGDAITGIKQIAKAVYEGMMVATYIIKKNN